ncbi:MAG: SMP-30/gluconolactonase/LRE family protein [Bryobacterales bacterium]|nr:SMP-30/gluconolactonase/LRE family protein [Bryobacterales bacterium]
MRFVAAFGALLLVSCAHHPAETKVVHVTETVPRLEATAASITAFTEGPTADKDGNIYFTEHIHQQILKMDTAGKLSIFRDPSNNANGLLFDEEERLIACEGAASNAKSPYASRKPKARVTRTNLRTGEVEVLADGYEGQPFDGPNDVTMDSKKRLYFTDLPGGAVYRIDPDKKITRLLNRPEIQRPNGIAISPDDRTLYLVEANQAEGGARMLRAYDLQPDGTLRNMRVFHNFSPGRSADGLCMDSAGNLHAAAGLHQRRGSSETLDTRCGVYVFSPEGKLIRFIPIPEDTITNCAFGGKDLKTLYVTAGKGVYEVGVPVAGTRR